MASPSSPSKPRSVLVLVVLTAITLITITSRSDNGIARRIRGVARDAFGPIGTLGAKVTSPIGDAFSGISKYRTLKKENEKLQRDVDRYRSQALQSADARRERAALLRLDKFENPDDIKTLNARVLGASPSNFELTIEIDRGSGRGVALYMPVVTEAGLIGQVVSVSRTRAVVRLITDPRSSIGVRLAESGDVGIARGVGPGASLPISNVDLDTNVAAGEAVFTSGLQDSRYPAGILVGTVEKTSPPSPGELHRSVSLRPVVNFRRLGFVKVLLWQGAG